MSTCTLGGLSNPRNNNQPLEIDGLDVDHLLNLLGEMWKIRFAERLIAAGRRDKLIGGPVHLGVGQEAVAVGVSTQLRNTDRVFGGHRSHSHIMALGTDQRRLFSEILGRANGLSGGMGGSMHLWDQPNGFFGAVPIVAGTVPLAVGAALAAKLQDSSDVGVAYLGDGAVEEGVVNESLNLAQVMKLPMLFVVENNLFASHMHISTRQDSEATARYAEANGVRWEVVDGNDVVAIEAAAKQLVDRARAGEGPGFLEAVTYRWYGHVDWREDVDVGIQRSRDDIDDWRARDPISRLTNALVAKKPSLRASIDDLEKAIENRAQADWDLALSDPYPEPDVILSRVYADTKSEGAAE